ncbi:hypothetical protein DID78_02245 [Candidatus Marinamargulisbacteria bacterium SCGC AG-343-D04]|nr:hypothetical protein DID78_02245 [Candidatus Marinamargulisbacteria bacterium SCGC AG-343-D04]
MKKKILAVFLSGLWMNLSEFVRNELLFKSIWIDGFQAIGLSFPSAPINGALWVLWSFIFVAILVLLIQKFSLLSSTLISWTLGFLLMWLGLGNLGILPQGLLWVAVPWSFVEVYIAALIGQRVLRG